MSIPKEPRQLMVNLMYLVLTALLALNVSAEILNAFSTIDRGLGESSQVVSHANGQIFAAISSQADAYTQFEPFREKADEAMKITDAFVKEVEQLKQQIIEAAGGLDEEGKPVRKTDKDIPTRILLNEGKGAALKIEVEKTRENLLNLLPEQQRVALAAGIPLQIAEVPAKSDKNTWEQYTFQQMPVVAVLPILSKLQNDARIAETTLLNFYLEETNVGSIKPDQYIPMIAADQSYVIRGEPYRGEIVLAAYSSTADNISVSVDGRTLPVENGKAIFTSNPSSLGTKKHRMSIELTNPVTGEKEHFERDFSYEVGERSVAVSAEKMNVFYVGVDNPVAISVAGVPSGQVNVSANGVSLQKLDNNHYLAKADRPGEASITVSGGGLEPSTFKYRVKRIPDPVIRLGTKSGGILSAAELKAHRGLIPVLEGFDFDATCRIQSFNIARVPKNDDVQTASNNGGAFESRTKAIIDRADHGDVFYFDEIKVRCPGDSYSREVNGLIFRIR